MTADRDYMLGTHDDENARLGLQHRVWRPRCLDAWRRAGFTVGQTLLDIGCGPGHATLDLAQIVGPHGRIVAIDRSRRFLDALEKSSVHQGLHHIQTLELDLDDGELPAFQAHGAWSRWVFAFVQRPRDLLARVHKALAPGGALVLHEYIDYSTMRLAPRVPAFEHFVRVVMKSWRSSGGEPDIGLQLPIWLQELGFELRTLQPIVDVVPPTSYMWQWPKAFVDVGLRRLIDIGAIDAATGQEIATAFAAAEAAPYTLMVTPTVLEIIAVRR